VAADANGGSWDLVAAGMPKTTCAHQLAVVDKPYGSWPSTASPTTIRHGSTGPGLVLCARHDTSVPVVLTSEQVDLLLQTAARPRRRVGQLVAARPVAIVSLFTLGLW
jgi:hypothetical protein